MEILEDLTFTKSIGYTGFLMLTSHALPNVFKTLSYVKDMSHVNEKTDKVILWSSLCLNIISGSLIIVYGILIKSDPISYSVPSFIATNLMCVLGMLWHTIKDRYMNRLY
jgi:uncharacterized protein with PQ loop repeat